MHEVFQDQLDFYIILGKDNITLVEGKGKDLV
jgi:hypothetical protein